MGRGAKKLEDRSKYGDRREWRKEWREQCVYVEISTRVSGVDRHGHGDWKRRVTGHARHCSPS